MSIFRPPKIELSRKHPLAKGLIHALPFGERGGPYAWDHVKRRAYDRSSGTGTWIATNFGHASRFAGQYLDLGAPVLADQWTVAVITSVDTSTTTGAMVSYRSTTAGNPIAFSLQIAGSSQIALYARDNAGTLRQTTLAYIPTNQGSQNRGDLFFGKRNGNDFTLLHSYSEMATLNGSLGAITVDKLTVGGEVNGSATVSNFWTGNIASVHIWDRDVPNWLLRSMRLDPWGMYRRRAARDVLSIAVSAQFNYLWERAGICGTVGAR